MADEKVPRHKKAYKDSPTLKRKDDGKMGISRGEKKAAQDNSGTDGVPEHESHVMEMSHKHEKERLELHQKHEKEHHSMRSKHMKALAPEEGGQSKETEGSGEGKEKIEKVEKAEGDK